MGMTEEKNTSAFFSKETGGEGKKIEKDKERMGIRQSGPHSDQCMSRMGEMFASSTMMDLSRSIESHLKNPVHHLIQESRIVSYTGMHYVWLRYTCEIALPHTSLPQGVIPVPREGF